MILYNVSESYSTFPVNAATNRSQRSVRNNVQQWYLTKHLYAALFREKKKQYFCINKSVGLKKKESLYSG